MKILKTRDLIKNSGFDTKIPPLDIKDINQIKYLKTPYLTTFLEETHLSSGVSKLDAKKYSFLISNVSDFAKKAKLLWKKIGNRN